MFIQLKEATADDVFPIVELRAAVAVRLTTHYGKGPWSHTSTEKAVRFEMQTSRVLVAKNDSNLMATLRLATKKPWAVDLTYFRECRLSIYLQSMAVSPELQRQGIGRQCVDEAVKICGLWPADAIRLDAYDSIAGAGQFYEKCGFIEVGRKTYRGCPLIYYERTL